MPTEANSINAASAGIVTNTGTGFTGSTVTQHGVLVGGASNAVSSTSVGSTGQILQANTGANPTYSTATYPSTAGTSGKVLISDGTNIVSSTPTFPNASATAGKFIRSDGTNWIASTPTLPTTAGTSGNFLQSDGTNWNSNTTLGIANGGTNATSFTQSNGIVTYNGTSLVNYAGPQLSSGGLMTNTTQPSFLFYLNLNTATNLTGDGTTYTLGTDALTQAFQRGSNMTTGGTFTAPVTGFYIFTVYFYLYGLTSSHTSGNVFTVTTGRFAINSWQNPFAASISGEFSFGGTTMINMTAGDTAVFRVQVSNGTKVVGLGGVSGGIRTYVSGYLVC